MRSQSDNLEIEKLHPTGWWSTGMFLLLALAGVLVLYRETAASLVNVWSTQETFAHGFLIVPISLWLVWRKRKEILAGVPEPKGSWMPVPLVFAVGLLWSISQLVDVLVVQQVAFVTLLIFTTWAIIGNRAAAMLLFPLFFLYFMVPIGEELVPPMMEFTADFTVALIKLSGIPIYREGLFFSLPSGDWSVVKACSGIRYLIASVTLGTLYAYLTYTSYLRRALLILASIVVPIIANGIRAYIIVMIGHMSDMKLAVGVDHLIYGWLFFGLVMLILFSVGSIWRQDLDAPEVVPVSLSASGGGERQPLLLAVLAASAVFWPIYTQTLSAEASEFVDVEIDLPLQAGEWSALAQGGFPFDPEYSGYDSQVSASYENGAKERGYAAILLYLEQRQGKELINSTNVLVKQKDPAWKRLHMKKRQVPVGDLTIEVRESRLQSGSRELMVWHWNWIAGTYTSNDYLGKLLEAKSRIFKENRPSAAVMVAVDVGAAKDSKQRLQKLVSALLPSITSNLEKISIR